MLKFLVSCRGTSWATSFLIWALSTISPARTQNSDIQTCLQSLPSSVVSLSPSSSSYQQASKPYNLRVSVAPSIIVYPSTIDEVSQIIRCANSNGKTVSARSGGHSYAAYALSGDIVIDLGKLKTLIVDSSGLAVSQTGVLLGELAEGLWNQGQRALPHGTCPYVGTGGHALYGGFGLFSRVAGLLLDRILSAEVVLANGSIVTASQESNPDLFWAVRGGGPSFGVVTSWTFNTLAAPPTTVTYQINFGSILTTQQATTMFLSWQSFVKIAPNELSSAVFFGSAGNGQMYLGIQGTYYGSDTQLRDLVSSLLSSLPGNPKLTTKSLSWLDGLTDVDGSLDTRQPEVANTFYAKSLTSASPATSASVLSWMEYLYSQGLSTKLSWFAQADLYGGAISSIPADATAFAHRDAFLVYQFYANTANQLPPFPDDGVSFVNGMLTALEPQPRAAYPNYIDPILSSNDWQSLYFGSNIDRLKKIKEDIDPGNVFNFQQVIPIASSGSVAGLSSTGSSGPIPTASSGPSSTLTSGATMHPASGATTTSSTPVSTNNGDPGALPNPPSSSISTALAHGLSSIPVFVSLIVAFMAII